MSGPQSRLESSLNPQLRQLFQNQVINVTGAYFPSTIVAVPEEHKEFALLIATVSAGTPTSVELVVQFSFNDGIDWFDPGIADWENLVFSVTGTNRQWVTNGKVAGNRARVRAIGIGTVTGSSFLLNAWLRTT